MTTALDTPTRADLAADLAAMCHAAKRTTPVVGTPGMPTPWDVAHERIDAALDQLEARG